MGTHYGPRSAGNKRLPILRIRDSLFGQGEQGAFYVPQPVILGQQVLFQDAAGTTPVVDDGDPVGLMLDLSGNGNHATQSVSGNRPISKNSSYRLVFDGVNDVIRSSVALTSPYTIATAISLPPGSSTMYGFGGGYLAAERGSGLGKDSEGNYFGQSRDGNSIVEQFRRREADGSVWVAVMRLSASGTLTLDDEQGQDTRTTSLINVQMSTGVSVGRPSRSASSVSDMLGDFWGGIVVDRFVSDEEVLMIRSYFCSLAGIELEGE